MTTPSEPNELEPKQQRAIVELMSARTLEEAAERAGVGERTLRRWLRESERFRAELRARQREAMESATRKLQAASSDAIDALARVIADPNASHAAVVSAAKVVLDSGYRGVEIADLAARLEELGQRMEQHLTAQGGSNGGRT